MMTVVSLAAIAAMAAVPAAAGPSLEQIIAGHIEAHGGAQRWREIQSLEISGSMTYLSRKGSFKLLRTHDGKYLFDSIHPDMNVVVGYDGKLAWRAGHGADASGLNVTGVDGAVVLRETDFPTPLFDYKERGYEVTLAGPADFEGRKAIALQVERGDGFDETWYLDPVTFLEIGRLSPGSDFGNLVPMRTYYDDFRTVAGVKIPFRIESQWHVLERILDIESIEANVAVDAARFDKPLPSGMEPLHALAGDWKVAASQSAHPGAPWRESERASRIEKLLGGALLVERYTTASGQEVVRSYTYDRFRKKYRVTEISDASAYLDIQEGGFDEQQRLVVSDLDTGTPLVVPGHTVYLRLTISEITPDGFKIEKEVSLDAGKEWSLAAKAVYRREGS